MHFTERTVHSKLRALTEDSSTADYRDAAEAIVGMRSAYRYHGMPDWTGRSLWYREAIERIYRDTGMPPDSESTKQSRLRYHISNIVREVAPEEDLRDLGLNPARASDRAKAARRAKPKADPAFTFSTLAWSPLLLATLAHDAVRLLNDLDVASDEEKREVGGVVQSIIQECVDYLRV